jgi:hypothetical protein
LGEKNRLCAMSPMPIFGLNADAARDVMRAARRELMPVSPAA